MKKMIPKFLPGNRVIFILTNSFGTVKSILRRNEHDIQYMILLDYAEREITAHESELICA